MEVLSADKDFKTAVTSGLIYYNTAVIIHTRSNNLTDFATSTA